jgi:pyruvate,water dikinase
MCAGSIDNLSKFKFDDSGKVLRDPHKKTVNKGDVLVAYTTDPGWTPLFVNAAAVVLEVGGILQHGAVIAREYGKPCVVGIDGLMTKLHDGQRVEVDGRAGVIRLLSQPGRDRDEQKQ